MIVSSMGTLIGRWMNTYQSVLIKNRPVNNLTADALKAKVLIEQTKEHTVQRMNINK